MQEQTNGKWNNHGSPKLVCTYEVGHLREERMDFWKMMLGHIIIHFEKNEVRHMYTYKNPYGIKC